MIRSYQRIFRPDRRLYQIDGRRLPVPGGVPLRWLGWAAAALLAVLVLSAGSAALAVVAALGAGLVVTRLGRRELALACSAGVAISVMAVGLIAELLDWPVRLVVVPALLATLATQATPDGRDAHRFAWSWLSLRLSPRRRSLGRPLPLAGRATTSGGQLWVAAGEGPKLRRGRVRGPASVAFANPICVTRRRFGRRLVARPDVPPSGAGKRRGGVVQLGAGEVLEVRP